MRCRAHINHTIAGLYYAVNYGVQFRSLGNTQVICAGGIGLSNSCEVVLIMDENTGFAIEFCEVPEIDVTIT